MNVRITAVVLLTLALACAADEKPKKRISTKKQVALLVEALAELAKLQEERHDEVIDLLEKDDSCLTTDSQATTEAPAACPQPTTNSLGGAECDVTTEGGPWTVVQRRTVGDVLFNMTWADYKVGFGSLSGDHWIGNDALNELCPPARPCQLLVEVTWPGELYFSPLTKQPDGIYTTLYGNFAVADEADLYRLTVDEFDGNSTAWDWLLDHDGYPFSTVDSDNDNSIYPCSEYRGGAGWWFYSCGSGLNGDWSVKWGNKGMAWVPVSGNHRVATSRMMVRPAA